MAHATIKGERYEIRGNSIELFKLYGEPSGKYWTVGIPIKGDNYFLCTVAPMPALNLVLDAFDDDKAAGNLAKIKLVTVSNRVAVRLWLEGVLTRQDFAKALEGSFNDVPYIALPSVKLDEYTVPLVIFPETMVGMDHVCTVDANMFIVGDGGERYPYLPEPGNLPLLADNN
jgi:hypothetical protein